MALATSRRPVGAAPYTYTILPINPGTTLELPYFSLCEQVAEGGGSAIDNLHVGCAIEDFTYQFNYGPGRASSKMTVNWVGSGLLTTPSGITVPALTTENNMLAASMSLSVNGVDYVATKRILSGSHWLEKQPAAERRLLSRLWFAERSAGAWPHGDRRPRAVVPVHGAAAGGLARVQHAGEPDHRDGDALACSTTPTTR